MSGFSAYIPWYLIYVYLLERQLTLISSRAHPHEQWLPIGDWRPLEGYFGHEWIFHPFILLALVWVSSGEAMVKSLLFDTLSLSLLEKVHRRFCDKAQLNTSSFTTNVVNPKRLHTWEHGAWPSWLLLTLSSLGRYFSLWWCCCGSMQSLSHGKVWAMVSWWLRLCWLMAQRTPQNRTCF